jgi:predicted RNA-binding protein
MTARWLCISSRENVTITRKMNIWGVANRFRNTITKVKKGDTLLMYTMQERVHNEVIESAITGVYQATSEVYEDESPIFVSPKSLGTEVFPIRMKVKPVKIFSKPLLFKPLVPEMSFIRNKQIWSAGIRTAMRLIPEEDYQLILLKGE